MNTAPTIPHPSPQRVDSTTTSGRPRSGRADHHRRAELACLAQDDGQDLRKLSRARDNAATWQAYGGTDYAPTAAQATKEQQIAVAEKLRAARGGYSAWPACSRKLGLGG
jgi:hypothetical protein